MRPTCNLIAISNRIAGCVIFRKVRTISKTHLPKCRKIARKIDTHKPEQIDPNTKPKNITKHIKNIKYFKVGVGEKNKTAFFNDEINNYKNSGSYEISNKYSGKKILINSIDQNQDDGLHEQFPSSNS